MITYIECHQETEWKGVEKCLIWCCATNHSKTVAENSGFVFMIFHELMELSRGSSASHSTTSHSWGGIQLGAHLGLEHPRWPLTLWRLSMWLLINQSCPELLYGVVGGRMGRTKWVEWAVRTWKQQTEIVSARSFAVKGHRRWWLTTTSLTY